MPGRRLAEQCRQRENRSHPNRRSARYADAFLKDNIWKINGPHYSPTGQGAGDHLLKITATSNGVSTYNYLPVNVIKSGRSRTGRSKSATRICLLDRPTVPTDGMDIAVIGAADGTSTGMVFASDNTYHFWTTDYTDGSFGLYNAVDRRADHAVRPPQLAIRFRR